LTLRYAMHIPQFIPHGAIKSLCMDRLYGNRRMSVKSVIIELELGVVLVSGKREYTELAS
jgi:hypothetical protein